MNLPSYKRITKALYSSIYIFVFRCKPTSALIHTHCIENFKSNFHCTYERKLHNTRNGCTFLQHFIFLKKLILACLHKNSSTYSQKSLLYHIQLDIFDDDNYKTLSSTTLKTLEYSPHTYAKIQKHPKCLSLIHI